MNICLINNNNEKYIVDLINNSNKDIIFINTKGEINKIVNMLPPNFDNYGDITNNNNLLILYNTTTYKVIYRNITYAYILIIIKYKLLIFINEINNDLINCLKKIIKLKNNKYINISEIFINLIDIRLTKYINLITTNIKQI